MYFKTQTFLIQCYTFIVYTITGSLLVCSFKDSFLCIDAIMASMAPHLSACTFNDMVWQRVCWKLLENVPQRWMESVLTGLVQAVHG